MVADATAKSIETIANAIQRKGGEEVIALRAAEQYILPMPMIQAQWWRRP